MIAATLQDILAAVRDGTPPPAVEAPPAFRRLAAALASRQASATDRAVLLRQALRHWALTAGMEQLEHWVPAEKGWPGDAETWSRFGVGARPSGAGFMIKALPWRPTWLPDVPAEGVDATAMAEWPRRAFREVTSDPYVRERFNRERYHSRAQRVAMRAAFSMPPGAVLLVLLPTGEGKSFAFQAIADVGFGDGPPDIPGVTLVVVPTVALAVDHGRAALELDFEAIPRTYRAGDGLNNEALRERIRSGTQGLFFASPEAVTGPLRGALREAAVAGYLRALAVDEAHIVDSWGPDFRPEFQVLAGLRRELLALSPTPFRTLLLSATVTARTGDVLRGLFPAWQGAPWGVVGAAALRPEPEYWVAPEARWAERNERVFEAIYHLPRPAIVYTTRVDDAIQWHGWLHERGFRRLALMHGQTAGSDRERIIDGWRAERIDLVVATSAFGLGIDYGHVRSVIHACLPETLDRFYQEVGRGGRDGNASLSLLVPAELDEKTARGINLPQLITPELGRVRWRSMFESPHCRQNTEDPDRFVLRLDVAPGTSQGRLDMNSQESVRWNVRVLNLMANAGVIQLLEAFDEQDEQRRWHPYQAIELLRHDHRHEAVWQTEIEAARGTMHAAARRNLARLKRFQQGRQCGAVALEELYHWDEGDDRRPIGVGRACGGCPWCRAQGTGPSADPSPTLPHPWPPLEATLPPSFALIPRRGLTLVFYRPETLPERLAGAVGGVMRRAGIRNLSLAPSASIGPSAVHSAAAASPAWVIFIAGRPLPDLPPGASVRVLGPHDPFDRGVLATADDAPLCLCFVPETVGDPNRPGRPLREAFGGTHFSLEQLEGALSRS